MGSSAARDDPARPPHEDWNFRVLFSQGILASTSRFLCSARLALPYLFISFGGPAWLAAILLPVDQTSGLLTPIAAVPIEKAARTRKWFMACGAALIGIAFATVGLLAPQSDGVALALVFLGAAATLGVGYGLNGLAFHDLMPRLISEERRSALLFSAAAISGVLAAAFAWGIPRLTKSTEAVSSHLALLWGAVAATLASAIVELLIREPDAGTRPLTGEGGSERTGYLATLRGGLAEAARLPWFRTFLVQRTLLQSVELAMPFYAIHAAKLHHAKAGSLSTMVVASSAAAVVGGLVWRHVSRRSIRRVMVSSALAAALGGGLALFVDGLPADSSPLAYTPVIFFVAVGSQGSGISRTLYLARTAPDTERPFLVATSNSTGGLVGIVAAFALGMLGHLQDVTWPLFLIVGLNLIAGLHVKRLAGASEG